MFYYIDMEKLVKKYPISDFGQSEKYIDQNTIFCDIETLGFSPMYHPIYLIGVAFPEDSFINVTLFFAQSTSEEPECIEAFITLSSSFDRIITFNGDTFDIPFIKKRGAKFNIDTSSLEKLDSCDLLKVARRYKKILSLEKCNQKSIESFMGITREDKYTGGELIDVYKEYCKDKTPSKKDLLITHNFDDVCGMVKLIPILAYSQLEQENNIIEVNYDDDDDHLIVKIRLDDPIPAAFRFQDDNFYLICENNTISIAIARSTGVLKYYLPYPAKYVYLLEEKNIIPKKLASSIDSDKKRPAKAEECFVEASGSFLGISMSVIRKNPEYFSDAKIFHKEISENIGYIKTDVDADNREWLSSLIRLLIRSKI